MNAAILLAFALSLPQSIAQSAPQPEDAARWRAPPQDDGDSGGRIGVSVGSVDQALAAQLGIDAERALLFSDVLEGEPAAEAGIQRFDVLTAIDHQPLAGRDSLKQALAGKKPGDTMVLEVRRRGDTLSLPVVVAAAEDDPGTGRRRDELFAQLMAAERARATAEDAMRSLEVSRVLSDATLAGQHAGRAALEVDRAKLEAEIATLQQALGTLFGRVHATEQHVEEARAHLEAQLAHEIDQALREGDATSADAMKEHLHRAIEEHVRATLGQLQGELRRHQLPQAEVIQQDDERSVLALRGSLEERVHEKLREREERHRANADSIEQRLQRIEERLARIEELLQQARAH